MTEPHASTVAAAAGGFSLVAGTVLGLSVPALVFGLFGALLAIKLDLTPRTLFQRAVTISTGVMLAAVAAPIIVERVRPDGAPEGLWIGLAALLIGSGAEVLLREGLQLLIDGLRRFFGARRDAQ